MTKKDIMTKAHQLAKTFIGDYAAKLSLALKIVWASIKKGVKAMDLIKKEIYKDFEDGMILLLASSNKHPTWIAKITGTDSKYGLKRDFINGHTKVLGRCLGYELKEGTIYNWKEAKEQQFGIVENGVLYEITKTDAENLLINA